MSRQGGWIKRMIDLAIGVPLAIASLPVVAVMAGGSLLVFRANPFFVQDRIGHRGVVFRFVKLRTLPTSAPPAADKYTIHQYDTSRFGRLLRRFHLDELPQLWHVVGGTMSLVGPRPEMPSLAATFEQEFVMCRTTVMPGCTGLWQVSVASSGLIGEQSEFDLHYVAHRTHRLDLWLLWRTLLIMAGREPLATLAGIPAWTGAAVSRDPAVAGRPGG